MKKDMMPFKKLLEKNGYEFTIQKQKILRTVLDSGIHLQAKEIHDSNIMFIGLCNKCKM